MFIFTEVSSGGCGRASARNALPFSVISTGGGRYEQLTDEVLAAHDAINSDALDERRLRRLIEVGRTIVSQLDLEVVLRSILEVARELTGARYAAIGILDEHRRELERFLTVGIDEEARQRIGDLPRGRGVLGELIRDPRPLMLSNVGDHARSYGFPPGHPPMESFLGVPVVVRGEVYGNLYLTEKAQGDFDVADQQSVVLLADFAAIAIDNARLYKAVWDRRDELEQLVGTLQATGEIMRALGGETELERVLELIVKRGRALVEARSVMILLEQEGGELVVAATAGEISPDTRGKRVPSPKELGVSATSSLMVPMEFRGNRVGVLAAFDRLVGGPEFRDEDEDLLRSFAASAAAAVHTAKSVAEERLRHSIEASEQERRRWARELHDETLQGLGALQVVLSSALRRGSPEDLAAAVRDTVDQIGIEIENLRNLITELRPAALDEIGLQPAIESLAERVGENGALAVETNVVLPAIDGRSARLPADMESTVYRLVQEALTNVAKHARASTVTVTVMGQESLVEVTVSDDGIGFDPVAPSSGFGMPGMRERVALAGGKLQVESESGSGTTVRALLPLAEAPAKLRPLA
jgi:signal transduction histidine kinase